MQHRQGEEEGRGGSPAWRITCVHVRAWQPAVCLLRRLPWLCALCVRNPLVSSCNNPQLLPPRVRTHSTATYTRAVWMEAWRWRPLTTLRLLHVDTAREHVTNARQCTPVAFRCLVPRLPETAWVRQARACKRCEAVGCWTTRINERGN